MARKIKKPKIITNSLFMLGIILINLLFSPMALNAYGNYNLALEKGTQIMDVIDYDEQAWKTTVNMTSNPNNWFRGEADKVGAQSKTTILGWSGRDMNTYGMFDGLIIPRDYIPIFNAIHDYGYNHSYITNKYSYYYDVWDTTFTFRSFTLNTFSNFSDFTQEQSLILQDPGNISELLGDYNEFADIVNNDTVLQLLNYTLPILRGDDFLWQFVLERFMIGTPVNYYLTALIGALECNNVSIHGNTLTIKRNGLENYNVEVTYNNQGNLEAFLLQNSEGDIIYKINSYYPKITIIVVVGICSVSILALITIFFLYNKKRKN
jgi:hypothetical protein